MSKIFRLIIAMLAVVLIWHAVGIVFHVMYVFAAILFIYLLSGVDLKCGSCKKES